MSDRPFLIDREGETAILTINREAQRNSLSFEMWEAFPGYIKELDSDPSVRVIVLTGAGDGPERLRLPEPVQSLPNALFPDNVGHG